MDYLLDAYLYPYLPVELDAETKKDINQRAVRLVQVRSCEMPQSSTSA